MTPRIIANINETLGEDKDYSLLDGFDELPEEEKAKVRRALEQGHVDDTDWRGVSRKQPVCPLVCIS